MIRWIKGCCFAVIALAATSVTEAGAISLRWDPVAGATGYRVYYGTSSGTYNQLVNVGSATNASISGLNDCTEYFVSVKAYNGAGESPQFSNEVSGWARPEVDSFGPGAIEQGEQVTLNINGANFASGAELRLVANNLPTDEQGEPLVRIESYSVSGCDTISALLAVEPLGRGQRAMEIGDLALTFEIVNPDSVFGEEPATLTIQFAEERADINQSDSTTRDRLDGQDLIWMKYAHGSAQGGARFNPDADLDGDGTVDGDDLALLATSFGECWNGNEWLSSACS